MIEVTAALVLNVIVASFTSFRFSRVGLFRWRTLWPFLIGAIPLGFIGGAIVLPTQLYRPLVGLILFAAAARFLWPKMFLLRLIFAIHQLFPRLGVAP